MMSSNATVLQKLSDKDSASDDASKSQTSEISGVSSSQQPLNTTSNSSLMSYKAIRIASKIEEGSFAVVYKASFNGHNIAVKKLNYDALANKRFINDFMGEVKFLSQFDNPYIIKLYQCTDQPLYSFVMEYHPHNLYKLIEEGAIKDWNLRIRIMYQIACGLAYLHKNKIIYRDLKPDNTLLDENFNVKLCDFGLATQLQDEEKQETRFCGSPIYIAPETWEHDTHYFQSDIFALAMVMWNIVTLQTDPYPRCYQNYDIGFAIKAGKRPQIPQVCPEKLASLITWGFKQNYKERPTAQQMVDHLMPLLSHS